jgi:hypothetical protein
MRGRTGYTTDCFITKTPANFLRYRVLLTVLIDQRKQAAHARHHRGQRQPERPSLTSAFGGSFAKSFVKAERAPGRPVPAIA